MRARGGPAHLLLLDQPLTDDLIHVAFDDELIGRLVPMFYNQEMRQANRCSRCQARDTSLAVAVFGQVSVMSHLAQPIPRHFIRDPNRLPQVSNFRISAGTLSSKNLCSPFFSSRHSVARTSN